MGTSRVIIKKASYDYATLKPLIFEMADSFCPHSVRSGSRVVIKPNLLAPAPPDRAIVTHPMVVKGIVEYLLHRGARVSVSDSQAMGTFQKVLKESGLRDALKGLNVECREFRESVRGPLQRNRDRKGGHGGRCGGQRAETEDPCPDAHDPRRKESLRLHRSLSPRGSPG